MVQWALCLAPTGMHKPQTLPHPTPPHRTPPPHPFMSDPDAPHLSEDQLQQHPLGPDQPPAAVGPEKVVRQAAVDELVPVNEPEPRRVGDGGGSGGIPRGAAGLSGDGLDVHMVQPACSPATCTSAFVFFTASSAFTTGATAAVACTRNPRVAGTATTTTSSSAARLDAELIDLPVVLPGERLYPEEVQVGACGAMSTMVAAVSSPAVQLAIVHKGPAAPSGIAWVRADWAQWVLCGAGRGGGESWAGFLYTKLESSTQSSRVSLTSDHPGPPSSDGELKSLSRYLGSGWRLNQGQRHTSYEASVTNSHQRPPCCTATGPSRVPPPPAPVKLLLPCPPKVALDAAAAAAPPLPPPCCSERGARGGSSGEGSGSRLQPKGNSSSPVVYACSKAPPRASPKLARSSPDAAPTSGSITNLQA